MTEQLQAAAEIITRWIGSCINETQLDVCANSIENCIKMRGVWEDSVEVVEQVSDDLKVKLDHKRHSISSFPGAVIPLPGTDYTETEK